MKIIYAGMMRATATTHNRIAALRRMGHIVIPFDTDEYESRNPQVHKITFRLVVGRGVNRLNSDLLQLAATENPDIFWADKVLSLKPRTLRVFNARGIFSLCYVIDNPFGPRRDPGWRLYKKTIPFFDMHCTQRDVSLKDLRARGARHVVKTQTAYDPLVHFPPPKPLPDVLRDRYVSFLGSPYDDRAAFLIKLHEVGIPIVISGARRAWEKALPQELFRKLYREGELGPDHYREAIWRTRINLSFLTKSNHDEFTQKSFEIAACGGFLLAERSQGHSERFVEGLEALFFSTVDECIRIINEYLPNEDRRNLVAKAGHTRAEQSGYSYDHQLAVILDVINGMTSVHDASHSP